MKISLEGSKNKKILNAQNCKVIDPDNSCPSK